LRLVEHRDARCVGPTSAISRLRTSTRASSVLLPSCACARAAREDLACFTAVRLASAGPHDLPAGEPHRGGRCLPVAMPADRASDTPVASPRMPFALARWSHPGSRRGRRRTAPVKDASQLNDPRCLPSLEGLRPATPFRASGSGLRRGRGFATAIPALDAFSPVRFLAESHGPGSRPRAPSPGGTALLRASASLADFCNRLRRAGTPDGPTGPRTRVGLSPRCTPAPTDAGCVGLSGASPHRGPASHDPLTPAFARRAPLAWTGRTAGRSARAKANRALLTRRACPPRCAPGTRVTGSTRCRVWKARRLVAPAEILLGCRLAKGDTVERIGVPSIATEPLREREIALPCAPGPPAPSRRLVRGIAPGPARLLDRVCGATF